jgi:exopolyphosphatase/guanosine-5'-triphosphate,3'-diphosphate pyrophosphatase
VKHDLLHHPERESEQTCQEYFQILSQGDEASHVSRGLTLNLPEATGLVADLGGGSIEITALRQGEVCPSVSLNYGHLSSVTASEIGSALAKHPWIRDFGAKQLFGVGGSFRTIGSAFINRTGYPLHVLHGLKIKRKDVLAICRDLRSDEPSLEGVPPSRVATIPVAAMIIRELIEFSKVYRLTVSGTSVRDGVIAINELNANQQADFLMAVSEEIADSTGIVATLEGGTPSKEGSSDRKSRQIANTSLRLIFSPCKT